ncbi:MAG: HD domain-containing phosphohydrolase [Candidatus Saccharicenans sp.]
MWDITERKKTEAALRESEENFRSIVEYSHEGIFMVDDNYKFIYCNDELCRMLDYSREEIIGQDFRKFLDEESRTLVADRYLRRQRGEELPHRYEFNIVKKDGSKRRVEISSTVIKDSTGKMRTVAQLLDITERKKAEEINHEMMKNLRKALNGTINVIASVVEARDPFTSGHQRRVADLARTIATEMGLPQDSIEAIRSAAIIHDLGKIQVPADILNKPSRLNEMEFNFIKAHPKVGYEILKDIEFPWPVAQIVYQHHERWNGSGYPQGLSDDEILLEARILAVADVVEAMASHRPYRPALGVEKALEELSQNRGKLYDPRVVDACFRVFKEKNYAFK